MIAKILALPKKLTVTSAAIVILIALYGAGVIDYETFQKAISIFN